MRLSAKAMRLLEENNIKELQVLPLEELLSRHDFKYFQEYIENPIPKISRSYSLGLGMIDSISLESLSNPVVVSNGRIFSKKSMDDLLALGNAEFKCPETRDALLTNYYDNGGLERESYVLLPQLRTMLLEAREARDRALRGRIVAEATAPSPIATNFIDTMIATLPEDKIVNLQLYVSGTKLRVDITGIDVQEKLKLFFRAALPSKSEVVADPSLGAYYVKRIGRCWQTTPNLGRLEFWFPNYSRITDNQVNDLIAALLKPLDLPAAEIPEGAIFGSIATIGVNEFCEAVQKIEINLQKAGKCMRSFLDETKKIADSLSVPLNDEALRVFDTTATEIKGRMMFFGNAPSSQAGLPSSQAGLPPAPPVISRSLSSSISGYPASSFSISGFSVSGY